jgi:single-strand DNA-binding protein
VVAYRRNAEVVHQFAKKGAIVLVDGHLATRSYEDKDGIKRYTTEIIAESIRLGPNSSKTVEEAPGKRKANIRALQGHAGDDE